MLMTQTPLSLEEVLQKYWLIEQKLFGQKKFYTEKLEGLKVDIISSA